jgi:hypothetical protein
MPSRTTAVGNFNSGDVLTDSHVDSLPGGWLGYASTTAAQSVGSAEGDLAGLAVTVTVNANRKLRITGYVPIGGFGAGTADERAIVRIKEGTTEFNQDAVVERMSGGTQIQGVANPVAVSGIGAFAIPAAGPHTYKLSLEGLSTGGASTATTTAPSPQRPAWILVEDIGPAS